MRIGETEGFICRKTVDQLITFKYFGSTNSRNRSCAGEMRNRLKTVNKSSENVKVLLTEGSILIEMRNRFLNVLSGMLFYMAVNREP